VPHAERARQGLVRTASKINGARCISASRIVLDVMVPICRMEHRRTWENISRWLRTTPCHLCFQGPAGPRGSAVEKYSCDLRFASAWASAHVDRRAKPIVDALIRTVQSHRRAKRPTATNVALESAVTPSRHATRHVTPSRHAAQRTRLRISSAHASGVSRNAAPQIHEARKIRGRS
jgi:hypothetical protein